MQGARASSTQTEIGLEAQGVRMRATNQPKNSAVLSGGALDTVSVLCVFLKDAATFRLGQGLNRCGWPGYGPVIFPALLPETFF
jgi:hypothetical protein